MWFAKAEPIIRALIAETDFTHRPWSKQYANDSLSMFSLAMHEFSKHTITTEQVEFWLKRLDRCWPDNLKEGKYVNKERDNAFLFLVYAFSRLNQHVRVTLSFVKEILLAGGFDNEKLSKAIALKDRIPMSGTIGIY